MHELDVHFLGHTHEGHAEEHSEKLLKHLEEDDSFGPSLDRVVTSKPTVRPIPSKAAQLQAVCEMKSNRAIQQNKHRITGKVVFTQTVTNFLNKLI